MKTEKEIKERIKKIEEQQKKDKYMGYLPIQNVRSILINNLKWVLDEVGRWN